MVSVSRWAGPPHLGQAQSRKDREVGRGEAPLPGKATSSGRRTGRFSAFSGTTPQVRAVHGGDGGAPVALAGQAPVLELEGDGLVGAAPSRATMASTAASLVRPVKAPEFTRTPGSQGFVRSR